MTELKIWGGGPLVGSVAVSGAKNGALPLLFASVIAGGSCTFYHVPNIGDVRLAVELLAEMGAYVSWADAHTVTINTSALDPMCIREDMTTRLRASSYLLGACLGRFGLCPPLSTGGCDFGARPLDCHYAVFHALGAVGERELEAPQGLHPTTYCFSRVSVGATINALLTAACIPGESIFYGCAVEPHVSDLARFLVILGAEIEGIGTPCLRVRGTKHRGGGTYVVSPDDIEAGTFLLAVAACGGDITLRDVSPAALDATLDVLARMGCEIASKKNEIRLIRRHRLDAVRVETAPAPGFPTDLHPPLAAALCFAAGESYIRETVWQKRFRYVEELRRMGAEMTAEGDTLCITPAQLSPATVTATDLRGGAALVIAALATHGESTIRARTVLERGYEDLPRRLRALGAQMI